MFRTPKIQTNTDGESSTKSPPKTVTITSGVRKSIGEWEAAGTSETTHVTPVTSKKDQAGPAKPRTKKALSQDCELGRRSPTEQKTSPKPFANRVLEARACLNKAKLHLNNSRNLKSDIKSGVIEAIDRLYRLVKESEQANKGTEGTGISITQISHTETQTDENTELNNNLFSKLQETVEHIKENNKRMEQLKETIERREILEKTAAMTQDTYASVAATKDRKGFSERTALHSMVIASKDVNDTGENILDRIREAVDAKEGWVKVERVRKAKDRKVIMGFGSKEDRNKVKERLEREGLHLSVEEMKNKDPLLILKDVLKINSDEDIVKALRNQNRGVFHGLDAEEDRIQIKYKRKSRNPLTCNVIISVSPTIWKRATEIGTLHIDLQRVRVEDQSPLVQCTRCLGYGHGRRFCKDPVDLCSHCGGPHLRSECAERLAGQAPSCRNCEKAKLELTNHNAFSYDCPTRRRWDQLARTTVAYC